MKELIRISENEQGTQAVSARELHKFLVIDSETNNVGEKYTDWIRRMVDYGFEEGLDYDVIELNYLGDKIRKSDSQHVSKIEYALTLDCAKEISMIQRNDKGKQARKYFIEVEKQSRNGNIPKSLPQALRQMAEVIEREEALKIQIEENRNKVVFAESVKGSTNSILVREYAKNLCDGTFEIGQKRLYEWFRTEGYLSGKNEPYQRYVDQGLFEVIRRTFGGFWGTRTEPTTKITGKGQVYFAEKIKTSF